MMLDDCYVMEGNAMFPYVCELRTVFDTVIGIAKSDMLDFDKARVDYEAGMHAVDWEERNRFES